MEASSSAPLAQQLPSPSLLACYGLQDTADAMTAQAPGASWDLTDLKAQRERAFQHVGGPKEANRQSKSRAREMRRVFLRGPVQQQPQHPQLSQPPQQYHHPGGGLHGLSASPVEQHVAPPSQIHTFATPPGPTPPTQGWAVPMTGPRSPGETAAMDF